MDRDNASIVRLLKVNPITEMKAKVAMTAVGILGALTRDLFVGDSRVFVVSYLFVGKFLRDFAHWVLVGDELRRSFTEQVLIQGGVGALYVAGIGLGLTLFVRLTAES